MTTNTRNQKEDDLGLREIIAVFWIARWLIIPLTIACTGIAIAAVFVVPKTYTASAIVSAVTDTPGSGASGGLAALASQFGGLASMAGVSLSAETEKKSEFLAVLQSESLTEAYITRNNLLPILYANRWSAETRSWKAGAEPPTLWVANRYFKTSVRSVETDAKTGLVTVSIAWGDPKIAAKWANDLIAATNSFLRDQAIAESERNITYLGEEAAKTDLVAVRQAISSVMETELNKAMLARGSEYYALRVIDPAFPPERPSSPKLLLWAFVGFFVGSAASIFLVLIRRLFRDESGR
jgi:uncharacterized protein involved in exopolysaccharide biosynthesis